LMVAAAQFRPITDPIFQEGSAAGTRTEKPARKSAGPYSWKDPRTLPPRAWLYGTTYLRGIVTVTIAPGGVGKSTLKLTEAVAMATGRPLLGVKIVGGTPLRVWYWNGEDSREELEKKVAAILLHYEIDPSELGDRLILDSGHDLPLRLVVPGEKGSHVIDGAVSAFIEGVMESFGIDVGMFDPVISLHSVDENSNSAIDMLAKELARIGVARKAAIAVAHHARKTSPTGTGEVKVDDSRGAKAMIDACRVARVLNTMSEQEAVQVGVEDGQRFRYFRTEDGKASLAPRAERAQWFRFGSVSLDNATDLHPADSIGVVSTWTMPGLFDQLTTNDLLQVQQRFESGAWRTSVQSPEWGGNVVAEVLGLNTGDPADKSKIKALLNRWMKSGAIKQVNKKCPDRKDRPCFAVGEWANG
jgi:hypothetical protein